MKLFKNNQKGNALNLSKGFTLAELLVVVGILAVLLAITLIAINPGRQFAQANNTQRQSDVNAILNAIHQYMTDNNGQIPNNITTTVQHISSTEADICESLVTEYIGFLPRDPLTANGLAVTNCAAAYDTNYRVVRSATNNRITVAAPAAELNESISVTR